jgi:signal transduction histidine kinase/CheY-like chemotaxis protein
MRLVEFIRSNVEPILSEFEAFARTMLPAAADMTIAELRNDAEKILRAVAEDMETPQSAQEQSEKSKGQRTDSGSAVQQAASAHGLTRLTDLFNQNQLVAEYRALRASVIMLWTQHIKVADRSALDELTRFNEAIDQALGASVTAFAAGVEQRLRRADRRKDEFLATLAHELRNPLAPITIAARIAKSPNASAAQLRWSQDVVERQVQNMTRLLDDLLDVSRITQNKLGLRTAEVELAAIIDNAVEIARLIIEARGHRLNVTLPESPVHLVADALRLAQVFSNILINAAKFTERNGQIDVSARVEESFAVIVIRDYGFGIEPHMLQRVFEMFSQGSSALDRVERGLGVGLAVVKGLVELHGGNVEARSEGLGRGSEFIVRIPVAGPAKTKALRSITDHADSRQEPRRIVIADDNPDAVASLKTLLELDGHEVLAARDGEQAFEIAAATQPEVMLLDIGMPKMNGYEVAKKVRAAPWGAQTKLIAISGWGQAEDVRRATAAGFEDHLTKPINYSELQSMLRRRP